MENRELMYLAENAKQKSYSPYSRFKVGAALLTKDGKIYVGANIENSSYPLTVCAERVAFFKAISEGEKEFELVERFAFYERAKKAYAVVATGETAIYANIILKKGVVIQ